MRIQWMIVVSVTKRQRGGAETRLIDNLRRTNLVVLLANAQMLRESGCSQVQPTMCHDTKFPSDSRGQEQLES